MGADAGSESEEDGGREVHGVLVQMDAKVKMK